MDIRDRDMDIRDMLSGPRQATAIGGWARAGPGWP
jgi:hypothetical protein